jgi:CRISPR/Cas system CMR subunit Cmr4 (Cas7 group RAMP superfamily)
MSAIYVTKLLIETQSPMAINSGAREIGFDTQLARDASGLPYIPGTAIAGVWSHLVTSQLGEDVGKKWFGTTEQSSTLVISHGVLHDANNQPVPPLIEPDSIERDPILSVLALERPHHRERVAINDRGVAKETGKFDQLLLPKGVRFSVTLKWNTQKRKDQQLLENSEWQELLALWNDRKLAFGSSTRNGLGKIKVLACEQRHFDLVDGMNVGKQFQAFMNKPQINGKPLLSSNAGQTIPLAMLPLQALDNWRCGSGSALLGQANNEGSVAIITYSEPEIIWKNNHATLSPNKPILCGSSIKGLLAHRMAFHLRRHQQIWAEDMADCSHSDWQQAPKELDDLFGYAATKEDDGQAGQLFVDDSPITYEHTTIRTHNKIDRFTGGVQRGALFSEELLYQPKFTLTLWLTQGTVLSSPVKNALIETINDLEMGLLPMGAGSGRGTSLVIPQTDTAWVFNANAIQLKTTPQGVES